MTWSVQGQTAQKEEELNQSRGLLNLGKEFFLLHYYPSRNTIIRPKSEVIDQYRTQASEYTKLQQVLQKYVFNSEEV